MRIFIAVLLCAISYAQTDATYEMNFGPTDASELQDLAQDLVFAMKSALDATSSSGQWVGTIGVSVTSDGTSTKAVWDISGDDVSALSAPEFESQLVVQLNSLPSMNDAMQNIQGGGAVTSSSGDAGSSASSDGGSSSSSEASSSSDKAADCTEQESADCSLYNCVLYPASRAYCPCTCSTLSTSPPTPSPTDLCVESDLCNVETCEVHAFESNWFCPCTCPGSGGSASAGSSSGTSASGSSSGSSVSSGSSSGFTSTGSSTITTGFTTAGTSSTGFTSGSTSSGFTSSGSTFSGFTTTGMSMQSGFSSGGFTTTGFGTGAAPLILNCELLPKAQCHGRAMGTNRYCMWHSRDGRCHDGQLNSPEDFCAQMGSQVDCNARSGSGNGAPGLGCCWDAEGYCDGFDASDCMVMPLPVGTGVGTGMSVQPGMTGGVPNQITGMSGEMEYEHPEYEHNYPPGHPEYEHPEYEHPEYPPGHPEYEHPEYEGGFAHGPYYHPFKKNTDGEPVDAAAEETVEAEAGEPVEAEAAEPAEAEPAEPVLKLTHQALRTNSHPKLLLVGVSLFGIFLGLFIAFTMQHFCCKARNTDMDVYTHV